MTSPETAATESALGFPCEIDQVERQLAGIWESNEAATKASLVNFVIISHQPGSLEENHRLVGGLTRDHACRVILVEAAEQNTAAQKEARAWITAHCHLRGGSRSVCSEQIAFRLGNATRGTMRHLLLKHLQSDLPVVVWWQGEPGPDFEPRLTNVIDRLIVDSSRWPESTLAENWQRILKAAHGGPRPITLHDLAWSRGHHWRQAVASLFDHPHAAQAIHGIHTLRIASRRSDSASARFLAAWLASALHLEPADTHIPPTQWVTQEKRPVRFLWEEAGERCLSSLDILADEARVSLCQKDDHHLEGTMSDGSFSTSMVLPAESGDDAHWIAALLSRGGKSSLHPQILPRFLLFSGINPASALA